MNRELPEIEILGTVFQVDVVRAELREKDNPLNVIFFSQMEHDGYSYFLKYDKQTRNIAALYEPGNDNYTTIELPLMVSLDPKGVAMKYGIDMADLPEFDEDLIDEHQTNVNMEQIENHYQTNLETGKLNIHTTKKFYDALPFEQRRIFTKYCLWSKKQDCWISKGKAENCYSLKTRLNEMGFVMTEAIGEKISFEEQVKRQQEKAEYRVENSEIRAEKAENRSNTLSERASDMLSVIPPGQPILIGHHSEKRDRNYREKISTTFRRAREESNKADYYREKAATAKYTAEGKKFTNPKYLMNRIKEGEKNLRYLNRYLEGRYSVNSPGVPISEERRKHYNERIAEEKEKLEFYNKKMKEINPDWNGLKDYQKKNRGKKL